jgi:hypothetical protein
MTPKALTAARAYHDAWTTGDFAEASTLLADDLEVQVPINEYPTKESFVAAVTAFGGAATKVDLLSALGDEREASLLYDMEVPTIGRLRVAEHFTLSDSQTIARIRQIHDTTPIRAAMGDR